MTTHGNVRNGEEPFAMSTRELVGYPVNVKLKISSLWIVTLFVFAYVDICGFFRKDVLESALAGKVGAFDMNQKFLLLTTAYVLFPGGLIFLTLVMKPAMNRMVNIVVSLLYITTFALACIGEHWAYFLLGSLVETILLITIVGYASKWPRKQYSKKTRRVLPEAGFFTDQRQSHAGFQSAAGVE